MQQIAYSFPLQRGPHFALFFFTFSFSSSDSLSEEEDDEESLSLLLPLLEPDDEEELLEEDEDEESLSLSESDEDEDEDEEEDEESESEPEEEEDGEGETRFLFLSFTAALPLATSSSSASFSPGGTSRLNLGFRDGFASCITRHVPHCQPVRQTDRCGTSSYAFLLVQEVRHPQSHVLPGLCETAASDRPARLCTRRSSVPLAHIFGRENSSCPHCPSLHPDAEPHHQRKRASTPHAQKKPSSHAHVSSSLTRYKLCMLRYMSEGDLSPEDGFLPAQAHTCTFISTARHRNT